MVNYKLYILILLFYVCIPFTEGGETVNDLGKDFWDALDRDEKSYIIGGYLMGANAFLCAVDNKQEFMAFIHPGTLIGEIIDNVDYYYCLEENKDVPLYMAITIIRSKA